MNKILTFFTAPVTAFFYPPVYKDAAKSSAGRGVLYCFYLAGLSTVVLAMFLSANLKPQADAFVKWTETNMPVLFWTPAGVSLEDGKTKAEMTHPKYGKIAIFDMTKKEVKESDLGGAYLFVTSTKVLTKRGPGKIEERDITGAAMRPGQQLPPKVRIDGTMVGKLYQNIKSSLAFVGTLISVIFFFVFFMITNLLYSLVGLLLNLMRKEKIGYGAILSLTCFATSVTVTLTWLRALPLFQGLSFPFAVNVLVNVAFMFFAFKVTDKAKEAV